MGKQPQNSTPKQQSHDSKCRTSDSRARKVDAGLLYEIKKGWPKKDL